MRLPGLGIVQGMGLTLKKFFEPKATIKYPEVRLDVPPKFRGRLQLLYDEYGTLKCETCFQCAQACPIECIDMGGIDTKGRYHIHWGAPETYGERRDESALRRSGPAGPGPGLRPLRPDPSRGPRGDPRALRLRPEADARDPRGDPGGVRPPAGRGAEADQPEDRRLVRDDLRHRHVLPPPAVRAAGRGAPRRGDRQPRAPAARPRTSPGLDASLAGQARA